MSQTLVVAFRSIHSCMVNLPARWVSALTAQSMNKGCMVFKISWSERSAYVAWSGGTSRATEQRDHSGALSDKTLEIDGTFATKLGLSDGSTVSVGYEADVGVCTAAEVVPEHFDDWEILELNAGAVEERLLSQARVVALGQPLVFWLNASTAVTLSTTSITPKAKVGLLDNDSEVSVAPKLRRANLTSTSAEKSDRKAEGRQICCLRVAAIDENIGFGMVFVHPTSVIAEQSTAQDDGYRVVRIGHSTVTNMQTQSDSEDDSSRLRPWLAYLRISEGVQPGVVLTSQMTLHAVGFSIGELVRIQSVPKSPVVSPSVLSFVCELSDDEVRSLLLQIVSSNRSAPIMVNVGVQLSDNHIFAQLESFQTQESEGVATSAEVPLCLTEKVVQSLEISCRAEPIDLDKNSLADQKHGSDESELAGIASFLQETWQCIDSTLMSQSGDQDGGILLCGRRGSGKTSIAKYMIRRIQQQRKRLVYCRHVDCTALSMDPRISTVKDNLQNIVQDVLINYPSILVLDDLDALLPAETEQSDSKRVRQLVNTLINTLNVRDGRSIIVLATSAGRSQVHERLFAAGVLQEVLEIPTPGKAERELILSAVARTSTTPADEEDVNYSILSYMTEGYMPTDLQELYERAVHEATMRVLDDISESTGTVLVRHIDLVRAHVGFKPMSLRNVQLQTSQTQWSDIGGLEDTRRQLRETLELPTKYAAIFASSPLRLRSGVLLFGYPGCGKTLLASAIARECGLNFIATKGPELLSKYIGSSEQSVRDLFKRAVAASPCVLFFDEFDSIAPRRGHDNTGVTDRVVNQLLTEMDGAEGLKGVYVLAATSRPDLIDPALLRPGRLDKAFLCDMPGHQDRIDILVKQASKVKVDAGVDWDWLAQQTAEYTGADIQALVYNAFLESVHEVSASNNFENKTVADADPKHAEFTIASDHMDKPLSAIEHAKLAERLFQLVSNSTETNGPDAADGLNPIETPTVTMQHFEKALEITQFSLGSLDRRKFEAIYRDFVEDKKASDDEPRKPIEQRATLA
ncbi:AAA-domain-containing protein [Coemansia reversa NRRL 1564]|uniref:Peroxisomal ATPase PEX1 n=1 Tax=Coemansia reversa (strain ATCC 12441 / NRRL 1564) TaxID=763665 RepID=A0A2G5B9M5_COERN|nr:AAA-domain-containing protein [Coemansia reversa NRRL 1564]|eukprot:PIA15716.1 AAA-domain-containing protein [Coemansia reversa NRRL 1564]